MFYYLFYEVLYDPEGIFSVFRVFKYITFRSAYAALTALFISLVAGRFILKKLKAYHINQVVKKEYLPTHTHKSEVPTMGGIIILLAMCISCLLWTNLRNNLVWLFLFVSLSLSFIGFLDDYLKFKKNNPLGLTVKYKLLSQLIISVILGYFLYINPIHQKFTSLSIPFTKGLIIELGFLYFLFVALIIIASSNAVNLTDGLDGLAIGAVIFATLAFLGISYLAGNFKFANYLRIFYIKGAGEFTIALAGMLGACLGFLWYNAYPAQVFMGDTGSLALGGILGLAAIITKQELLLLLIGGLFVVETLSVILQVIVFKLTKKRVFLISPLHHHYEAKGWKEPKIVIRLWLIAGILALLSLSALKLR
jgi:phospho-N-acetylmuramoyl-pentapeptide-transferase